MEKQDLDKILEHLKLNKIEHDNMDKNKAVIDWLFKALVAVIVYLGMGIKNSQNELNSQLNLINSKIQTMEAQNVYKKEDMEDVKSFMLEPRFTREDYEQLTNPTKQKVERVVLELESRNNFMQNTENRLLKLEFDLKQIKQDNK